MDERLFRKGAGGAIPAWDQVHRLSINQSVGPEIKDLGSTFSINSKFMDVIDPILLDKQWVVMGVLMAFLSLGMGPYIYWLTFIRYPWGGMVEILLSFLPLLLFGPTVWYLGPNLFFGLRYRPIRLHRATRKIYAIRRRRFFSKPGQGDIVWEAPWTEESIFCLHREITPYGTYYHIRHYTVDEQGKVTRAFSIGREWQKTEVRLALAQWNYWCRYMNDGPRDLPKPMLFHTRHETPRESFLFSLYDFGMNVPAFMRLLVMPPVLFFTLMRMISNATCRAPIWPDEIANLSIIAPDDPYAEPRQGTPIGWAETILAQKRGDYPDDDHARVRDWAGEPDGEKHADAWLDNPSRALAAQRATS